jgi:hypothetical protein
MRVMFDANPLIAIPLETYFPVDPPLEWFDPEGTFISERAVGAFERKRWFRKMPLHPGAFRSAVAAESPATYPDLVRCLYRLYAESQGKARYGNKTPRHVIFIPTLAERFPEARFVHIVRDGRDVTLSLLEVDDDMPDVRTAARFWRDRVMAGRVDGTRLGAERYVEVRYEDLLEDPEGELRRLCAFLDLAFDHAMLRYYERIPEMVIGSGTHAKLSLPPTKGLRDWRAQMAEADVASFEAIAGDALEAFGYPLYRPAPSRAERLRSDAADRVLDTRRVLGGLRRRVAGSKGARHA